MVNVREFDWSKTPCVNGPDSGSAVRRWWEKNYGPLPCDVWLLHYCDNGRCRNPEHIFFGTPSDNSKDREAKGRGVGTRGMPMDDVWKAADCAGNSKLTLNQVKYIRSSDKSIIQLCVELSVGYTVVWKAKTHRTWRHVA